ncbi:hypothetical protein Q7P37_009853 [Cladosporium fusiforme]
MLLQDLHMKDSPPDFKAPRRPTLRSPMEDPIRIRRSESPISDMELDNVSSSGEGLVQSPRPPRCGSLILRCADCSNVVLIEYGQGAVPRRLRLLDLTPRSNGVALTSCRNCIGRTRRGLEGRTRPTRDQYHLARSPTMCPAMWNASDFVKAAALVLEEPVALMMAGRVCLHIGWDRVARALDVRDRVVSLDVSQWATGDGRNVILPHLAGNWSNRGKRENQRTRAFCTQRCLLGLVNGGNLDRGCPNVDKHGVDVHRIDKDAFLTLMCRQLSRTLDSDFEPCGRPGSRGVPFRATLASHGYTVIAKCTPSDFGHCVPVYLGNLDLDLERPYYYEGIAKLVHVMFLGYGGTPILRQWRELDQNRALGQVEECLRAIHERGVLHRDVMPRNILWDCDSGRVTVIDFERAKVMRNRPILGPLSVNRKRKQQHGSCGKKHTSYNERISAQEVAEAKGEISCL